jgi:serine/threonine protein kinase
MGEVYRARDPRLNRHVAIKVLHTSVAGDPERLQRFTAEAQAVAALNHPNVLTVYEVGEHEGHPFMATELLEGETLRARLAAGSRSVPALQNEEGSHDQAARWGRRRTLRRRGNCWRRVGV